MSSDSEMETESDEDYDSDNEGDSQREVGVGQGLEGSKESEDELEFESDSDDEEHTQVTQPQNGANHDDVGNGSDDDAENDIFHEYDSDDALQDAFQKGALKPGLNTVLERTTKVYPNNVRELKRLLEEHKLQLPWVEKLDLVNGLAPLAPELAAKLEETQQRREVYIKNHNANKKNTAKLSSERDPVLDEFKREMNFHRQAQAAVLLGVPKLVAAGVLSKRPTDYFAEMAKSDEHMQKVRRVLMRKQVAADRSEKAKKQRQAKKVSREVAIAGKLKKVNEKREMLEEVRKFRKGIRKDLDFLEDKKAAPKKAAAKKGIPKKNKRSADRAFAKDKKFGFGGKKSGSKRNTSASTLGFQTSKGKKDKRGKLGASGKFGGGGGGGKPGGKPGGGKPQSRPGKSKRQQTKSRGKR